MMVAISTLGALTTERSLRTACRSLRIVPPRKLALAAGASEEPYIAPFSGAHPPKPAGAPATNEGIPSGLGDLSGLAVSGGYLYVAGEGSFGNEVLEYRLPFVPSEVPSGSVTGFSGIDFLGVAARDHTLFVASTTAGTVRAYHLPLRSNETPSYTIPTVPQIDGAVGVAVDGEAICMCLSTGCRLGLTMSTNIGFPTETLKRPGCSTSHRRTATTNRMASP